MIYSSALALLLGFELSYYLLIIQTGVVAHFHSDMLTLFPMFMGGVAGTIMSGFSWGKITNPIHKIMLALLLQLLLSFSYPEYNLFTLVLLGLSVGMMAPLGIYLFKSHQQKELFFALAIAYSTGTYLFKTSADGRIWMAVCFTLIPLFSAVVLRKYRVQTENKRESFPIASYLLLMLWILLDSNLFETLLRHSNINIWSNYTFVIIAFHILGLLGGYFIKMPNYKKHIFIALLFVGSYSVSYLELPLALAMVYPFVISYYNVVVFTTLTKEMSLTKLSFMMIFVGWVASGAGLAIALGGFFH
ncbi:hypothetical protein [Sulfurimonas sp.]|uniref:hypothetical protein n=1 Tax=Sulfurimonas sp. TaxID=2022749 RepID=UPI0025D807BF|nr:hypothetical protein [Sulfurimonas sp.]MDD5158369.1 hypothetical protein [Sulfurimonas sp.]